MDAGTQVKLGVTVETLNERSDGVHVTLSDGAEDSFDLVIGADGVNSKMRTMIFPGAAKPEFTGQGCFRTLAPRPLDLDMIEVFLGDIVKPGVTPISHDQLYMFTLTPEPNAAYLEPREQNQRVRDALKPFGGLIGAIRDQIGPDAQTVYRPLESLILQRPWHKGRVLLVGDAVHATMPQLASGACCAIEDGLLLAEYLKGPSSLDDALNAFTLRRFDRCRDVVDSSRRISELELARAPGDELAGVYADAMMRLAAPA